MSRIALAAVTAALIAAACARAPDPPQPAAKPASAPHIPTAAQLDRFRVEGLDPTLQKLRPVDYWLHYRLMHATGIEQALGGEAQAIAALQALADAYERKLRGAGSEVPRMIPAAFTGEGMSSGLLGLGMGSFVGMMTGGMLGSTAGSMSDAQYAELVKAGPMKLDTQGGKAELQFGDDGSFSQSIEFEVNEAGVNGKVKLKTRMEACPDPQGKVTMDIDVDSRMSVSGKPGTGGSVRAQFKYERYVDDDAHLIDGDDGGASNLRIQMGGIEDFQSQQVDFTIGHERGGKPVFQHHEETGFSIFRPEEGERTQQSLQGAAQLLTLMAESAMSGGPSGVAPWESGRCVRLDASSNPAKRTGIKPGTAFDLDARPRAKADGAPTGGTVRATLNGAAQLTPDNTKVKSDAKFGYTGPAKQKEKASIDFEARSRRGVGKATLAFSTEQDGWHLVGIGGSGGEADVCDLSQPFTVKGPVTVDHSPTSDRGGTTTYRGMGISGQGTYTISGSGDRLTATYSSTACYMGHCRAAKSTATLTRIDTCQ